MADTEARRARLVGLLGDLARTDVGQLVAASSRWLRRQLAREGWQCTQAGCTAPAAGAQPDGGPGGLCVAHLSPPDYWEGYRDGALDADADAGGVDPPYPEPGWAGAVASGREHAGGAYLVGYTDGYLGSPRL
jgi:hypothetical protein